MPLYKEETEESKIKVEPFYMDVYPVTNAQFLEFVKDNPKWLRSKIKRLFADKSYLNHWKSDLELGEKINPQSPVTNISWFAAKAYAKWAGKRLPTVAEWEYAASASKIKPNAYGDEKVIHSILDWYSKRSMEKLPPVGSTDKNYWGLYDLHGLIWEWTYDFNIALVTGESRGDASLERNLFCGASGSSSADARNYPAFMRYGFRSSLKADYTVNNLGFRCVKDICSLRWSRRTCSKSSSKIS
jgi:formylglycine-generating enzyme required for sulfatase activity